MVDLNLSGLGDGKEHNMRRGLLAVLIALLAVGTGQAEKIDWSGIQATYVAGDTIDFDVLLTGGASVDGVDLNLQIARISGSTNLPKIHLLDITSAELIFAGHTSFLTTLGLDTSEAYAGTITNTGTVTASGTLAHVQITTTDPGVYTVGDGTMWGGTTLWLAGVSIFPTMTAASFGVVPEPAVATHILTLVVAVAPLGLWYRRRSRPRPVR